MPLAPDVLAKYHAHTFVETGTYHGRGIAAARDAGFKVIHSIELDDHRYQMVSDGYQGSKTVFCHHGDSGVVLPLVIKTLRRPTTFWIDAHMGQKIYNLENTPIIKELEAIQSMDRKLVRAVLIDDMPKFSAEAQAVMSDMLRKIDPAVVITLEHGMHKNILRPGFVMAADFAVP